MFEFIVVAAFLGAAGFVAYKIIKANQAPDGGASSGSGGAGSIEDQNTVEK